MADAEKDLKIVISSDTAQAERNLGSFGGALGRIGEIAAGLGLERVAESVINFGKTLITSSVAAFNESEKSLAQLDAVLKSTAGVAGMSREALVGLSKQLQNVTAYSDEQVLSVEDLLLTFTKIGKDTFPEATRAVLDMSTALGEDTKSASIQLGKALQDPILGITALRRVGVNFNDDQKKMIEGWVKHGETLRAQKYILKEISTEFGGSATAAAKTYAGQMQQLKNVIDDIKEVFGKFIVEAISPFVGRVGEIIRVVREVMEGHKQWGEIINELKIQFPLLGNIIEGLITVYKNLKKFVDDALKYITDLWKAHQKDIETAVNYLAPLVRELWESIKNAIKSVLEFIVPLVKDALNNIKTFWEEWGTLIIAVVGGAVSVIFGTLKLGFDLITGIFKVFKNLFHGDWKQLWEDLKKLVTDIIGDITKILKSFFDWAGGIINGLVEGIKNVGKHASSQGGGGKALGGYASGMTLVGEYGPELVNLPSGSYVNTNQETNKMLGGITVNINNPSVRSDNDITDLVNQIKRALGRENELARLALI